MPNGLDTPQDTSGQTANIVAAGYSFVGRYLSRSTWKLIGSAEATALKAAGLQIVLVYEDGPTTASYFGAGRGTNDAQRALAQATAIGAPGTTAIYFAVDYDASPADIAGPIAGYFAEVVAAFAAAAAASGGAPNPVGVYGSGNTCSAIKGSGQAQFAWLAQSTGWGGYGPGAWDIQQSNATTACSLSVDLDAAPNPVFGAW